VFLNEKAMLSISQQVRNDENAPYGPVPMGFRVLLISRTEHAQDGNLT